MGAKKATSRREVLSVTMILGERIFFRVADICFEINTAAITSVRRAGSDLDRQYSEPARGRCWRLLYNIVVAVCDVCPTPLRGRSHKEARAL